MLRLSAFLYFWFFIALLGVLKAEDKNQAFPFQNPDLDIEKRVDDLISRLTIEEKISQTMMKSAAIDRLGIPKYHWWNEALHGVARNGVATVFPQAIALAATWNPEFHQKVAEVISTEARAKFNDLTRKSGPGTNIYQGLTIWSPNINIFRDPRWGRGQETYGEDPFLTSRLAVAFVKGLQGNDSHYLKTVATLKHFAVHSGPEKLRHEFNAVVSESDLYDTYLRAFQVGIREGGAWSVMSAYNAINGVPAPANSTLLQKILRDDWGFKGAVVGDVDTVKDISSGHKYAPDLPTGSALAIKAGNDLCSGTSYDELPNALKMGLLKESDIDVALRRLFYLRFKLGLFDPPDRVPYSKIDPSENDSKQNEQVALQAAQESMVLLKNDGLLPIDRKTLKNVVVLGPLADDPSAVIGNYAGKPSHSVTLLEGIRQKLEPHHVNVIYEKGCVIADGLQETGVPFERGAVFYDKNQSKSGFKRTVYANSKFSGEIFSQDQDEQVDLDWNEAVPAPGVPLKGASIRWESVIIPPTSGLYAFSIETEGKVKLKLDGQEVLLEAGQKKRGNVEYHTKSISLTKGIAVHLILEYVPGHEGKIEMTWVKPAIDNDMNQFASLTQSADLIILCLGINSKLEGEQMKVNVSGFDNGDRVALDLPKSQRDLMDKICALKKPVVLLLTGGSALVMDYNKPNAALLTWYYGEQGGNAAADILFGDYNPAGRLPITFYASEKDLPPFEDYSMVGRTYRYFKGKPIFPFGHGLSYTKFDYQNVGLSSVRAKTGDVVQVKVSLKNSGSRSGDEVVQVYARNKDYKEGNPIQSLVGFQRVNLKSGEIKELSIPVQVDSLRLWNEAEKREKVMPGIYEIRVGSSSQDIEKKVDLNVEAGIN